MGLHHNQYARYGLGLVHLGDGFRRGEERRGEERSGEERERERERERAERMTSMIQFMPSVTVAMKSYLGCDSGNDG
jgi:hypothetical protein